MALSCSKKLPALHRRVTSKHVGDFYCSNCLHSYRAEQNNKHTPPGHLLFTKFSFDVTKNKVDCYRGKYCIKRCCKDLKEHATEIIDYEKKNWYYYYWQMKKINHISIKKFVIYATKDLLLIMTTKNIIKSEIIVIVLENIEDLLMIFIF